MMENIFININIISTSTRYWFGGPTADCGSFLLKRLEQRPTKPGSSHEAAKRHHCWLTRHRKSQEYCSPEDCRSVFLWLPLLLSSVSLDLMPLHSLCLSRRKVWYMITVIPFSYCYSCELCNCVCYSCEGNDHTSTWYCSSLDFKLIVYLLLYLLAFKNSVFPLCTVVL